MTGVNIHLAECPYCSVEFYTKLPQESKTKALDCVECGDTFKIQYQFEEREEQIEVEMEVMEVVENDNE